MTSKQASDTDQICDLVNDTLYVDRQTQASHLYYIMHLNTKHCWPQLCCIVVTSCSPSLTCISVTQWDQWLWVQLQDVSASALLLMQHTDGMEMTAMGKWG